MIKLLKTQLLFLLISLIGSTSIGTYNSIINEIKINNGDILNQKKIIKQKGNFKTLTITAWIKFFEIEKNGILQILKIENGIDKKENKENFNLNDSRNENEVLGNNSNGNFRNSHLEDKNLFTGNLMKKNKKRKKMKKLKKSQKFNDFNNSDYYDSSKLNNNEYIKNEKPIQKIEQVNPLLLNQENKNLKDPNSSDYALNNNYMNNQVVNQTIKPINKNIINTNYDVNKVTPKKKQMINEKIENIMPLNNNINQKNLENILPLNNNLNQENLQNMNLENLDTFDKNLNQEKAGNIKPIANDINQGNIEPITPINTNIQQNFDLNNTKPLNEIQNYEIPKNNLLLANNNFDNKNFLNTQIPENNLYKNTQKNLIKPISNEIIPENQNIYTPVRKSKKKDKNYYDNDFDDFKNSLNTSNYKTKNYSNNKYKNSYSKNTYKYPENNFSENYEEKKSPKKHKKKYSGDYKENAYEYGGRRLQESNNEIKIDELLEINLEEKNNNFYFHLNFPEKRRNKIINMDHQMDGFPLEANQWIFFSFSFDFEKNKIKIFINFFNEDNIKEYIEKEIDINLGDFVPDSSLTFLAPEDKENLNFENPSILLKNLNLYPIIFEDQKIMENIEIIDENNLLDIEILFSNQNGQDYLKSTVNENERFVIFGNISEEKSGIDFKKGSYIALDKRDITTNSEIIKAPTFYFNLKTNFTDKIILLQGQEEDLEIKLYLVRKVENSKFFNIKFIAKNKENKFEYESIKFWEFNVDQKFSFTFSTILDNLHSIIFWFDKEYEIKNIEKKFTFPYKLMEFKLLDIKNNQDQLIFYRFATFNTILPFINQKKKLIENCRIPLSIYPEKNSSCFECENRVLDLKKKNL